MLTLTILAAMLAVPLAMAIAWALALLIAGAGTAGPWAPARVERRPAPLRAPHRQRS